MYIVYYLIFIVDIVPAGFVCVAALVTAIFSLGEHGSIVDFLGSCHNYLLEI